MSLNKRISLLAHSTRSAVFALMVAAALPAHAQTIWNGPNINFTQSGGDSDSIVPGVALCRGQNGPLYNTAAGETAPDGVSSPKDTLWAFGTIDNYASLSYVTFASIRNNAGGNLGSVLGVGGTPKPMVVYLINENIYLSLTFTAWGEQFSGGFAYTRSTAPVAAPTPSVSLTNPASGAVFAAPASVQLGASASVSSGTVTNVAFYANTTTLLGSAQASPFNITNSSLGAGAYGLTAVATAAGVSATSALVNITVVNPVAVSNSAPQIGNGKFAFSYSANAGLTYVVQDSSNLVNWLPLVTNVAASSSIQATDTFVPGSRRYYRVVRQPNP